MLDHALEVKKRERERKKRGKTSDSSKLNRRLAESKTKKSNTYKKNRKWGKTKIQTGLVTNGGKCMFVKLTFWG